MDKSIRFEGWLLTMMLSVSREVEEFHYEMRKGVSQNKYVFEVKPNQTWDDWENVKQDIPVPPQYVGLWMLDSADDLQYDNLDECLKSRYWVKCEKKELITYEYVEL